MQSNISNFAGYVLDNFSIILMLLDGYMQPEIAIICGAMLRECIRHENLAREIWSSDKIWCFFDTYVNLPNFEIASDAFETLHKLLTFSAVAPEYLISRFDEVFAKFEGMLKSDQEKTRENSMHLLLNILHDRRYVGISFCNLIVTLSLLCISLTWKQQL